MKTVQKFTTFEDLKSSEKKLTASASSLQKHNEFKNLIIEIRNGKATPGSEGKPKT